MNLTRRGFLGSIGAMIGVWCATRGVDKGDGDAPPPRKNPTHDELMALIEQNYNDAERYMTERGHRKFMSAALGKRTSATEVIHSVTKKYT